MRVNCSLRMGNAGGSPIRANRRGSGDRGQQRHSEQAAQTRVVKHLTLDQRLDDRLLEEVEGGNHVSGASPCAEPRARSSRPIGGRGSARPRAASPPRRRRHRPPLPRSGSTARATRVPSGSSSGAGCRSIRRAVRAVPHCRPRPHYRAVSHHRAVSHCRAVHDFRSAAFRGPRRAGERFADGASGQFGDGGGRGRVVLRPGQRTLQIVQPVTAMPAGSTQQRMVPFSLQLRMVSGCTPSNSAA